MAMTQEQKNRRDFVKQVSNNLPHVRELTPQEIQYAYSNCFPHEAYLCKNEAWCSECGNIFSPNISIKRGETKIACCPHCGKDIQIKRSAKQRYIDWSFYTIIDRYGDMQVVRHFKVYKRICKGNAANYSIEEVIQNWINTQGEVLSTRKAFKMCGKWNASFIYDSNLKVRDNKELSYSGFRSEYLHINSKCINPDMWLLPIVKRNGIHNSFHGFAPATIIGELLRDNNSEMLWKTRQYEILAYKMRKGWHGQTTFPEAVRIAIRNGYRVKDAPMWFDYLNLLRFFDLDTHNAYYVCPKDLKAEHDKLNERRIRVIEKRKKENAKKEARKWEPFYAKHINAYKDFIISDKELDIRVIPTVAAVLEEGEAMHHCVFNLGYYKREDVLLLSAKDKKGIRLETVEYNLKTKQVVQSRGLCNELTNYHERIVMMVENGFGCHRRNAS